jgi:hypothetical protein
MYKLLDSNIPPYRRYKPQKVPKSANMVIYCDKSIITNTTVDFSRPYTAPIDRQNKTAPVRDIAVPLTQNIPKTKKDSKS